MAVKHEYKDGRLTLTSDSGDAVTVLLAHDNEETLHDEGAMRAVFDAVGWDPEHGSDLDQWEASGKKRKLSQATVAQALEGHEPTVKRLGDDVVRQLRDEAERARVAPKSVRVG